MRPKLVMQYAEPLNLNLEPWNIPTNIVRNPMVSFSVARGITPWLSNVPEMKRLDGNWIPNQVTMWSLNSDPFGSRMAIPVNDASNLMTRIAAHVAEVANDDMRKQDIWSDAIVTNNRVIVTGGTPFVNPFLVPAHTTTGDILLGGLSPMTSRSNSPPMPADLLHAVMSDPKLVYYNWEINEGRISQWESMLEVFLITSEKIQPPATSIGIKWLQLACTNLGNCQTEILLSAPNELTMLRSAPVGLTGMEMALLQYWLDCPGFPLEIKYPVRTFKRPTAPAPGPGPAVVPNPAAVPDANPGAQVTPIPAPVPINPK